MTLALSCFSLACFSQNAIPSAADVAAMKSVTDATAQFLNSFNSQAKPANLANNQAALASSSKGYDLLVFISSSMPPEQIKAYSRQAKSFGATLVLKGFVNDKQSSTREFIAAMNEGGASWIVHPASFQLFKIESVPSIVLADASSSSLLENGCAKESTYTKVGGDITLDSALDVIFRRSEPAFAKLANKLLVENQGKYKQGSILSK